jgi:hypothetical protein
MHPDVRHCPRSARSGGFEVKQSGVFVKYPGSGSMPRGGAVLALILLQLAFCSLDSVFSSPSCASRTAFAAPGDILTWDFLNREGEGPDAAAAITKIPPRGQIGRVFAATLPLDLPRPLVPLAEVAASLPIIGERVCHRMVVVDIVDDNHASPDKDPRLLLLDFEPVDKTSPLATLTLLTGGSVQGKIRERFLQR